MTCSDGFEEGGDGRRTEGPVLIGYICGVSEAMNMGGRYLERCGGIVEG